MESARQEFINQGNSTISVEVIPDYSDPVVVKKPSKRHSPQRSTRSLENEYEMTRAVDGVAGIRKALALQSIADGSALILEYIDGETLRYLVKKEALSLRAKLKIAVDLGHILGEIHQQGVIHLDLNSKNILVTNEDRTVRLIDLGSASYMKGNGSLSVRPDQMLGTLPYIAPEQTGRINRAVDERSDLYSLGVILYELMAGQLPFDSKEPLQLVHDHIARVPVSPSEVSSGIPEVLGAIILKLLSKNAEDRYQSAAGVQADLEQCLRRLKPEDTIEHFPLAETDYSRRLIVPQKLYGRDSELRELASVFENVCRDTSSIVLIGGASGIGKTALAEEIQQPVTENGGYFIHGKFDQVTTTPYAGIAQALAQFVSQILTQTEIQLVAWRTKILEAVGPNGKVLTDVVPSLELVIGPQPAVPDLSAQDAQNRFNYVFQRFFGAVARREHPICFFLDDLQWIDPASLELLKSVFSSPDLAHLLLVGTYRDNEVDEDHPLMGLVADFEEAGVNLKRMTLPKLAEADVDALISDALRREPGEIQELSKRVYSQTHGNPFFMRQVLRSWVDEDLIALDTAIGQWRWDMDTVRNWDVTVSVVELLLGRLKELPVDIQETLKAAACIGNQFDIATLALATERDDDTILDRVQETVAAGLIRKSSDRCYFVHDRIQEAAYALMSPEYRACTHLTIGRLLLQRYRASDHEQDLFATVDQLNHGLHLIEDEQERLQIARLNLDAARAARQTSAFDTGLAYAKVGLNLLGETGWERNYRLTLALHEQAVLLARMSGRVVDMEYHREQVLQYSHDPLDTVRVQGMRTEFLSVSDRPAEAFDLGLEVLRILGQELPKDPDWALAVSKVSEMEDRLVRESPDFLSMPPMLDNDPELAAITEILVPVVSAAYNHRPVLAPLLFVRYLELCLERQHLPPVMPWVLVGHGVWVFSLLGKVEAALDYGETALQLANLEACHTFLSPALSLYGGFLHFWRGHLRESLDLLVDSIRVGHDYGDNYFISFSSQHWSKHALYASIELDRVVEQSTQHRAFLDSKRFDMQSRYNNIFITAAQALRGNEESSSTFWHSGHFDGDGDSTGMHREGDRLGLLFLYTANAWVATLFGDRDSVEKYSDLACRYLDAGASLLDTTTVPFICGLRRARELRLTPGNSESEQALHEQLGSLERFAGLAPMNFAHKLWLVQAEAHRARGEVVQAMQCYEKASQGARENKYLNEAGLAHALAAEFFQDLGLRQAALHDAKQAAQAWRSWGAHALVKSLNQRLPDLLEPSDLSWPSSSDPGKVHTTITQPITPIQLDTDSIISASQMLSAETDFERLLTKLLALVMANSGAEHAVLLVNQDNDWFVQARGDGTRERIKILPSQPFDAADPESDLVPESVFNYCRRTKETLVVEDAQLDHRFAKNRTIQTHNIKSIACAPVFSGGPLNAMLYLDNRQMANVFTPERMKLIKHLSSQFGVSMEKALLHDSLSQKLQELQEIQDRYQLAVAGSAAGIWDWDVRTNELYFSDRAIELFGYRPGEFEITTEEFWGRVHPDDHPSVLRAVDRHLMNHVPYIKDYRLRTKSGEYRWFHARGQAIWDSSGEAVRMSGSITDITPRKQAEESLKSSEERFRSLMEQSPLAIEILTPEGRITEVNAAWKRLWGLDEDEAALKIEKYNMLTDPQLERLGVEPLIERAFAGEPVILPVIRYSAAKAAGEVVGVQSGGLRSPWIQNHLYPVKDADGRTLYVVNTYMELTEVKRAEREAREQRDALARMDRTTSMGQLTGSIAHELNQPLTGILSNAQAAELMIESGNWKGNEWKEIMADIAADAKRAGGVIRNLRDLYREQKGEFQPVDINAVVTETEHLLNSEFVLQHVSVTTERAASIPVVNGNDIQIQQVLVNLITNGIQAMQGLAEDARRLHIETAHDADDVKIWVEDCGPGIDADRIDRVFEPLATWKPGGTGMGLAISNSIIQAHKGRMFAENKPGGGAVVGFVLPVLRGGQ